MRAIDTNVLVRLLVNDDEAQGARARAAFEAEDIWIGKAVLLETFWVLRPFTTSTIWPSHVRSRERWVCLECKLKTLSVSSWRLRPLQTVLTSPTPCTLQQHPAMLAPSQPSIEISRDAAKGD